MTGCADGPPPQPVKPPPEQKEKDYDDVGSLALHIMDPSNADPDGELRQRVLDVLDGAQGVSAIVLCLAAADRAEQDGDADSAKLFYDRAIESIDEAVVELLERIPKTTDSEDAEGRAALFRLHSRVLYRSRPLVPQLIDNWLAHRRDVFTAALRFWQLTAATAEEHKRSTAHRGLHRHLDRRGSAR
jgi:hypothetical protein